MNIQTALNHCITFRLIAKRVAEDHSISRADIAAMIDNAALDLLVVTHKEYAPLPLTPKQVEIMSYLREYVASQGFAPTFHEMADHFGYRSLASVHEHLSNLERKGHIVRSYNQNRAITLVENLIQMSGEAAA